MKRAFWLKSFFARISLTNTLTNLKINFTKFELLRHSIPDIRQVKFPFKNFARVANYKQDFKSLGHVCNFQ